MLAAVVARAAWRSRSSLLEVCGVCVLSCNVLSAWQCVTEIVRCSTCLLLDRKHIGPLSRLPAVGSRMLFSFHVSVVLG